MESSLFNSSTMIMLALGIGVIALIAYFVINKMGDDR
ncbi:MAG: hypothetical protein ACI85I_000469 [Arenicella sp.]|jgi:hypothetical protein